MKRIVQTIAVVSVAAAASIVPGAVANASQPAPARMAPLGVCPVGDCGPYGTYGACNVNRGEVLAAGGTVGECWWYGVVGPEHGWHFYRHS